MIHVYSPYDWNILLAVWLSTINIIRLNVNIISLLNHNLLRNTYLLYFFFSFLIFFFTAKFTNYFFFKHEFF